MTVNLAIVGQNLNVLRVHTCKSKDSLNCLNWQEREGWGQGEKHHDGGTISVPEQNTTEIKFKSMG